MTNTDFIAKLTDIAANRKTLYVMGCFGAPLKSTTIQRYIDAEAYNQKPERTSMIKSAADNTPPVFGFDCVNLIKGILWGWSSDAAKAYGGAQYAANGVPDTNANGFFALCNGSTNFAGIKKGEAVWTDGHIGVYIGDGKVIECTPQWKNCVQVTACLNVGPINGLSGRRWTKRGKIPYITYEEKTPAPMTAAEAIDYLAKVGEINSPGHWRDKLLSVEYLDALLIKYAQCAKRGRGE